MTTYKPLDTSAEAPHDLAAIPVFDQDNTSGLEGCHGRGIDIDILVKGGRAAGVGIPM